MNSGIDECTREGEDVSSGNEWILADITVVCYGSINRP